MTEIANVILYLIVAGVVWWAVNTILGLLPLPEPIKTVINVLLIVVLVLIVVSALMSLLGGVSLPFPRLR